MNTIDDKMVATLVEEAFIGRKNAYAPYSNFLVGAAVLGENGKIYRGCNIENVSYGVTVCGERVALVKMLNDGCKKFTALAVTSMSEEPFGMPCAACLQFMSDLVKDVNVPIILGNQAGKLFIKSWIEAMPLPFMAFDPTNA